MYIRRQNLNNQYETWTDTIGSQLSNLLANPLKLIQLTLGQTQLDPKYII